jgi:hypothetical protein
MLIGADDFRVDHDRQVDAAGFLHDAWVAVSPVSAVDGVEATRPFPAGTWSR